MNRGGLENEYSWQFNGTFLVEGEERVTKMNWVERDEKRGWMGLRAPFRE